MSSRITVNVSGRQYQAAKATLIASPYFLNLLERWDACADLASDGSYTIDADPNVFEHVLCFMRRPSNYPLFWTKEKGFDYVLYNKLEAEADFFLLHNLRDWIRQERYKDAVKTVVEVKKISEPLYSNGSTEWMEVDDIQWCFDSFRGEKKYRCPLGVHGSKAWDCACFDKLGDSKCAELDKLHGPQYDDPEKYAIIVVKRTVFDGRVCWNTEDL
jgi:hypothetical protein